MTLKEIEIQRTNLLEQIKVMKFQERDVIEKILKKCIPSFISLSWYDDSPNNFDLLIDDITILQILELNKELENWNFEIDAYDSDYIQIIFERDKKVSNHART